MICISVAQSFLLATLSVLAAGGLGSGGLCFVSNEKIFMKSSHFLPRPQENLGLQFLLA
jgi:hypothetical protein